MKSLIDRKIGGGIRRSESFHHSRSVGDLSSPPPLLKSELEKNEMFLSRQRNAAGGASADEEEEEEDEDGGRQEKKRQQSMNKSKSMDFLKAKLLNIKNKATAANNYNREGIHSIT